MPMSLEIMQQLKQPDTNIFIESGTGGGATCRLALDCGFKEVYSCELSERLSAQSIGFIQTHPRYKSAIVQLSNMDSRQFLSGIFSGGKEINAFVWLDAHFSGGITKGEGDDPILAELEIMAKAYGDGMFKGTICVDDCRGREQFVADKIIACFPGIKFAWQADSFSPTDIAVIQI